jgi:hypothetical protein
MARRVFFSFHYENDIWRVSQIRNCWVGRDREAAGFWDAASWEQVKRRGEDAIHRWIDAQLENTSVTAVLIGYETADRPYVNYEIQRSIDRGNGLLGIWIHNMKDQGGYVSFAGRSPFANFTQNYGFYRDSLASHVPHYDWVNDRGYENCAAWIEFAARKAGR